MEKFVVKKDKAGKLYFLLKAPNGQILAKSSTYESKAGVENGILGVKKYAYNAVTEYETSE